MIGALREVLETMPRVACALVFGSVARGTAGPQSDVDLAIGLTQGPALSASEIGEIVSRAEAATRRHVDLVLLDEAPPALAYRVFRDGQVAIVRDRRALVERRARAILDYLDYRPIEEECTRGVLARRPVVDKGVLARRIASVEDAIARIHAVLVPRDAFLADRTAREVVALNLFVAVQECLSLATHWLADEGAVVSETHRAVFEVLGARGVVDPALAARLAAAAGPRNLIAHQYGVLDWSRIHEIATHGTDDLLAFCRVLARLVGADQ